MSEVNVRRASVEVEEDFGGDEYRVACVRIVGLKEGEHAGLGIYRYFLNGRAITAKEADVRYYESERGKTFRRLRLQSRAEFIREFA